MGQTHTEGYRLASLDGATVQAVSQQGVSTTPHRHRRGSTPKPPPVLVHRDHACVRERSTARFRCRNPIGVQVPDSHQKGSAPSGVACTRGIWAGSRGLDRRTLGCALGTGRVETPTHHLRANPQHPETTTTVDGKDGATVLRGMTFRARSPRLGNLLVNLYPGWLAPDAGRRTSPGRRTPVPVFHR